MEQYGGWMHADEQQKRQVVEDVSDVQETTQPPQVEKKLESGVHSGTSGIWRGGEAELPSISTTTRISKTVQRG
jgi:hypothetical protein